MLEAMLQEGVLPAPFNSKYPNLMLIKDSQRSQGLRSIHKRSRTAKKLQDLFGVFQFNNKAARG
jgi:hypothetical protein